MNLTNSTGDTLTALLGLWGFFLHGAPENTALVSNDPTRLVHLVSNINHLCPGRATSSCNGRYDAVYRIGGGLGQHEHREQLPEPAQKLD